MKTENMLDLLVVRILLANPVRMIHSNLVPQPVSQIRVKFNIWMETVTSLYHALGIASLSYFSSQNFLSRKIVISSIKIFEGSLVENFLVDLTQILSSFSSKFSHGFVTIQPTPARTNFKAVKKIIN